MAKGNEIANGMRKFANLNAWLSDAAKLLDEHGTFEDAARIAKSQCDTAKAELKAIQDEMAEFKQASGSVKQAYVTALDKAAAEGRDIIVKAELAADALLFDAKDKAIKTNLDAITSAETRMREAEGYANSSKEQHLEGIAARKKEIADLDDSITDRVFKVGNLNDNVLVLETKLASIKAQLAKMIG